MKRQCENCGTIWTIHKLGNIPAREGFFKIEARRCTGEHCPGCMVWLDIKEENVTIEIYTPVCQVS